MNENKRVPEVASETEARYKGVAGWLKLFCFLLMLNPLFTLVSLVIGVPSIKEIPWFYWTEVNLRIPVILGIIFSIGLAVFSAYAGYGLFTRTNRRAVTIAKVFLLTVLVSKLVVTGLVFAFLSSESRASPVAMDAISTPYLWECIGTFVGVLGWWMYVNLSRRVEATYVD